MAQSFSILQNSFKHFCQGHYKEAMEQLQKFKEVKEQSDQNQSMVQINENIILCEYCIGRDAITCIAKLDEIIDDFKPTKQNTSAEKKQDDDSILQYNKAVMLFQAGRVKQSHNLLKQMKETYNLDIYLNVKVLLLLIETSFQLQEYQFASEIYKKLASEETIKQLTCKQQLGVKNEELQQQQQIYTSLLIGSDLVSPDCHPTIFSKEEYQFILSAIKFRFYMQSNSKDWKKVLSVLEQNQKAYLFQLEQLPQAMQQYQIAQFSNEISPYLKLQSHMIVKMLKIQKNLSDKNNSCIKMMNPLSDAPNQQNTTAEIIQNKQYLYQAQIFNNLGCIHAKLGKYSLATLYFHKAIQSIKQTQQVIGLYDGIILQNIKQRLYALYQNLADALYMDQKYQKALTIYNQLQDSCSQSQRFWYNRGVCYIQLYHESIPDKNEIYSVIEEQGQEETKKIILQSKEIYSDVDEEQQDQFYKVDQVYEESKLSQSKQIKELLNNAIKSFRNAMSLSKKEKKEEKMIQLDQDSLQITESQIFESSMVYLCYSLLCRGDYNQALYQGKEGLEYTISDQNKYSLIQYVIEAYIQINKVKEALQFLQNNQIASFLNKYNNNTVQFQCRNVIGIQTTSISNYGPKAIYHFNIASLNLHNNNIPQAWNSITALLNTLEININHSSQIIPLPILNLLIWYYLKTENTQVATHLIKRRRILTGQQGKNKITLLSISK